MNNLSGCGCGTSGVRGMRGLSAATVTNPYNDVNTPAFSGLPSCAANFPNTAGVIMSNQTFQQNVHVVASAVYDKIKQNKSIVWGSSNESERLSVVKCILVGYNEWRSLNNKSWVHSSFVGGNTFNGDITKYLIEKAGYVPPNGGSIQLYVDNETRISILDEFITNQNQDTWISKGLKSGGGTQIDPNNGGTPNNGGGTPPDETDNTTLYVGLGIGVAVILGLILVMK